MSNSTFKQINNSGSGTSIVLTANENITAGDIVGIASNLENHVMKAVWGYREQTGTLSNTYSNTVGRAVCEIDTDKYVVICSDSTPGYATTKAVVVQLDRNTMTWTIGALSGSFFAYGGGKPVVVTKLDTNKFLIAELYDFTTYEFSVAVGTVSGTTVTSAGVASISSTDSANTIDLVQINTNKAALIVSDEITGAGSQSCDLYEISVSGTTPTIGTKKVLAVGSQSSAIAKVDTDKIAIFIVDYNVGGSKILTASVSAGVWTVSSPVIVSVPTTIKAGGIVSKVNNEVYLLTGNVGGGNLIYKYDVSGVPTLLASGSMTYSAGGLCLMTDGVNIFMSTGIYLYAISEVGSLLTISGPVVSNISANKKNTVSTSNGYFIIMLLTNSTGAPHYLNFNYHIQGMTDIYTGIAQNTVSRGGSVIVKTSGIDGNQTGLSAGATYEQFEGGLIPSVAQTPNTLQATSSTEVNI